MAIPSTSEKQKTEAATSSSSKTVSESFSGFWYWTSEMERLGQWPGLSEAFAKRVLEHSRGNNSHARTTEAHRNHTPSVLRR